jgi:pimeloyl-ACP methyl ester carboxylesterase
MSKMAGIALRDRAASPPRRRRGARTRAKGRAKRVGAMDSEIDGRILGWASREGYANRFVRASDGTQLRVVTSDDAPPGSPRVVLLHGAPQMAYCWRAVMTSLRGEARMMAPDLRGYGASDLAVSGAYDLDRLALDLDELLDATNEGPIVLVGHDWGGVIGWRYAETRPERVARLVIVNAPHPAAYLRELVRPAQLVRSWYVFASQVPKIESLLARGEAAAFGWMLEASGRGVFSRDDLALYRYALARPGRAAAALAYYRQVLPRSRAALREALGAEKIVVPTTLLWGERDTALVRSQPGAAARYVERIDIRRLPGVSHWVPEERPGAVATAVREALAAVQTA